MAMPLLAQPVDFPGRRIEGSKQRGRAVALVIVRHGGAAAFLHREAGLCAVQRLYLALFIDAQHQCMLGRIQIQPNNGLQFLGELRIVADLEALHTMRLQAAGPPDARHRSLEMPISRAIVRVDHCVAFGGML